MRGAYILVGVEEPNLYFNFKIVYIEMICVLGFCVEL